MKSLALTLLGISLPHDATTGASTHWRLCSGTHDQGDVTLAAHEYRGARGVIRTLVLAPCGARPVRVVGDTWEQAEARLQVAAVEAGVADSIAALTVLGRAA